MSVQGECDDAGAVRWPLGPSRVAAYAFFLMRIGRPEKTSVRIVSWYPAVTTASLCVSGASPSTDATNRVPTHTADAPSASAAARPRPSEMPPAATTSTGPPVSGERRPRHRSATAGMRMLVATSPVWPPPSPPCAQITSTPAASAFATCFGDPIMFCTTIPALCSRSTAHVGGTPIAHTKSFAPELMITSRSAGSSPLV